MTATISGAGNGGGTHFPVIFNDGEQESDIGKILVTQNTDFKTFQTTVSSKIGISPNQFTTFLKHQNQPHRKIPMSQKINFNAVLQDTKYYFLVSLKRQRSISNRRPRMTRSNCEKTSLVLSSNVVLLRRGESVNVSNVGVCEECLKGSDEFHWCVRDAVVYHRFMSPAGPIAPPVKK